MFSFCFSIETIRYRSFIIEELIIIDIPTTGYWWGWGDYIGARELDIWCSNLKRYIFVKTKKFAKPFLPFIWCPGRIFEANKKLLKILWHCPLKKYMSTAGNQDVCVYWLDVDGSTVHYISGLGTRSFQKNATFLRSFPFFIKERNGFCVLSHSL